MTTLIMLDNVDSFTYNLVDEFQRLGYSPTVYRNHIAADIIVNKVRQAQQTDDALVVLSPGPGNPTSAGCLMPLIKQLAGTVPLLGICLGHQALIQHYGGKVVQAETIVHGKSSAIEHTGEGPFAGLANPLPVARYHSLIGTQLPNQLKVLASFQNMPMAVYHPQDRALGFQFHPESILTTFGSELLKHSVEFLLHQTTTSGECV
jgi:anthranilate synthase component 2